MLNTLLVVTSGLGFGAIWFLLYLLDEAYDRIRRLEEANEILREPIKKGGYKR